MPVRVVKSEPSSPLPIFAIVGQYELGSAFVRHVALARESCTVLQRSQRVSVWQMGPPLVVGPLSQQASQNADSLDDLDLIGFIELSIDDIDGMQTWLAEVDTERRPTMKHQHYAACPHFFWKLDEAGMPQYRRFSCTGLVIECYLSVDIRLLNINQLPQVDTGTLAPVYGEIVKDQRLRERLKIGLDGNGPWPVLLPGYLFHSLKRSNSEIKGDPHSPLSIVEASFPT